MKRLLSLLLTGFFLIVSQPVNAQQTSTNWNSETNLQRVNKIGQKLLTDNKLPTQITFKVSEKEDINAYANIDKEIYVYTGLLKFVENDDELAAVIAHEISHIANSHCQRQTIIATAFSTIPSKIKNPVVSQTVNTTGQLSLLKLSRNDEFEADLTGADLMVGAGYNPLGMISVLNKICGNYFDFIQDHPSGDKRTTKVYDYLSYNYPTTLKKGFNTQSYKSFQIYINNVAEQRKISAKLQKRYLKEQEKLKQSRIKRAQKIRKTSNPWDTSFNMLRALSQ